MWIKRDTTDIYYPEEKRLIRILSKNTLPTSNTTLTRLLNFDLEHRLHLAGFTTLKATYKDDTVFHYWEKQNFPEVVTGTIGDDLVLYRTKGRGWNFELKLWDYESLEGKRYPHFLRSRVTAGGVTKTEELRLMNIQPHKNLPQHLADFAIPSDARVETIELRE